MTREERTKLINHLKYNRSIGADYLLTDKDADEIIKALEQEPCDDAVSRQEVIKTITNISGIKGDVLKALYSLSSVKPQKPNTGHWIDNHNGTISCNRCHTWFYKDDRLNYMHQCPCCGAKML